KFNFDSKESGPSGGLITTLTIYNYLVKEDITNGLKIAGTGTIEPDGSVGEIGGIKYKLAGVVKKKADLFFCPAGENYEEAMKEKKKNKYKIKIIGVETLDEALNYLKNYKKKD
ncbi:MAG: S16 family serine protease, partial [Bacilli bacterium]